MNEVYANRVFSKLVELLEVPPSHYKLAIKRYNSLGDWFCREGSVLKPFSPAVHPQGSFQYGTVVRPILESEEYDLDAVCELQELTKESCSQCQVKRLVGGEVKAYAEANNVKEPVTEKKRCWRLDYADQVKFHIDMLPAIHDDPASKRLLQQLGVPPELAELAIAITDTRHPDYANITGDWPRSNPRGYAKWFEGRMKAVAMPRLRDLVEARAYATVDDVPVYEWKTPLQRAIQILKRHRDIMFKDRSELKPISMIITTLAALAYAGEADVCTALTNIVDRMPRFVRAQTPRVPNPVNPAEDFADGWQRDARLERCFWDWHQQVQVDIAILAAPRNVANLQDLLKRRFGTQLPADEAREITSGSTQALPAAAPFVAVKTPPKPWAPHA